MARPGIKAILKAGRGGFVNVRRVGAKIDRGTDRVFKYFGKAVYRGIRRKYGAVAKNPNAKPRQAPKPPKARTDPGMRTVKTPIKYKGRTPVYIVAGPVRFGSRRKVNGKTIPRLFEEGGQRSVKMVRLGGDPNRKPRAKRERWVWQGTTAARKLKAPVWQTRRVRWRPRPFIAALGKEKRRLALQRFKGVLSRV